jgi:hypothetical protein
MNVKHLIPFKITKKFSENILYFIRGQYTVGSQELMTDEIYYPEEFTTFEFNLDIKILPKDLSKIIWEYAVIDLFILQVNHGWTYLIIK